MELINLVIIAIFLLFLRELAVWRWERGGDEMETAKIWNKIYPIVLLIVMFLGVYGIWWIENTKK